MVKSNPKKTNVMAANLLKKLKPIEMKSEKKKHKIDNEKIKKEDSKEINPFTTSSERFEDFSSIEARAPVLETTPIKENLEQQITTISREVTDKTGEKVNVTYNAPDYGDEFYKRVNYGTSGNRVDDDIEMDITRGKLIQRDEIGIEQKQDRGIRDFGARFGINQERLMAGGSSDSLDVEEKYVIREKEKRERTKLPFEN
jgi:hypothetical protein